MKRGKLSVRCLSIIQIHLLVFSIIAFAGLVSAPYPSQDFAEQAADLEKFDTLTGDEYQNSFRITPSKDPPASATTPTDFGIVGKGFEKIYRTQPLPAGETYTTGDFATQTSTGGAYSTAGILQGALWAIVVYGAVYTIGSLFGLDDDTTSAIAKAASIGTFAGKGAYSLFGDGGVWQIGEKGLSAGWSIGVGIAVAAIVFYMTYKSEEIETRTFTCETWQAPVGGANCEKCNTQPGDLPCSEYQCRSLGQACQLLNQGTDEEKCEWVNPKDVEFPTIKPRNEALLPDYKYTPDNTINPPDNGVIIKNSDSTTGCAKAFTPLSFGITTNEPAKCKIDPLRKSNYDEMSLFFGGSSMFRYNHTQVMSLPSMDALEAENLTIENNGNFELYVRCMDANGNYNTANFVFKYCVEQGPDTTPPLIVTTNLLNGMPIAHDKTEADIELYLNEPAECKWSHDDQPYEDMENTFRCSSSVFEMNAQMLYECKGILEGIKAEQENDFYFRCKDKPYASEDRNTNQESYKFTLIGTIPLAIDTLLPNGTVKDSTAAVKTTLEVETIGGYSEGNSTCYYSDTGEEGSFIMFLNTNSYKHSQDLYLGSGSYKYYVQCTDLGGNTDTEIAKFKVESDTQSPMIVRTFKEETYLKLITDEEAECVYDTKNCNYLFEDGVAMTSVEDTNGDKIEHFTDWDVKKDFYIKCGDEYGNKPAVNSCSMIVRPFKIYEEDA